MPFLARLLLRFIRYLWPAPYTLAGLLLGLAAIAWGATARWQGGVLEISGGAVARWLRRHPPRRRFAAMTLGHVILALDAEVLETLRFHERVHVRQYERWGPFFLPAYLLSSLVQWLRGRDPYRENRFERQAYAEAAAAREAPRS